MPTPDEIWRSGPTEQPELSQEDKEKLERIKADCDKLAKFMVDCAKDKDEPDESTGC
jgi:hypothetical protein